MALIVSLLLISIFFLINQELKDNAAENSVYFTTTSYVAADQLNSTTNMTIPAGVINWVCFNSTGTGAADGGTGTTDTISEIHLIIDSQNPNIPSVINSTSRHDGADVNCTVNATNYAAPVYTSLNTSQKAIGEWADWTDIIIIIFAAAVILGLIFLALVSRRAM